MKRTLAPTLRLIGAAALALALAACDRPEDQATATRDHASEAVAAAAGQLTDAAITASVSTALARDPGLSALRIEVDTRNGTVSLHGNAPDPATRARATELARAIDGVVAVDNRLVVRG